MYSTRRDRKRWRRCLAIMFVSTFVWASLLLALTPGVLPGIIVTYIYPFIVVFAILRYLDG